MAFRNTEAVWHCKKRSVFEETSALSPIEESPEMEPTSRDSSPYGGADLPESVVERPKRHSGEQAIYYHHLRKRMRKYYRRIFNLRADEDTSGTEFDEADYDVYNPEFINVRSKHQDDSNVCHVNEEFDKESDLRDESTPGSLSSRRDSSEKAKVVGTSEMSFRMDEGHVQASDSKKIYDLLMESFISRDENNVTISTKSCPSNSDMQDINLRLSEEPVEIDRSGLSEIVKMDLSVVQEPRNSNFTETINKYIRSVENEIDSLRKKTDARKYEGHGDMEGEIHSHSEEKSGGDETEVEKEQLGESQDGDDDTKEYHGHGREEKNGGAEMGTEEDSAQLGESQDNENKAEKENSVEMEIETEEVEIMRSYNPDGSGVIHTISLCNNESTDGSVESMLHERTSDVHRHSLPQDEASFFEKTATPEEIEAADHVDEVHRMLSTSSASSSIRTATKRSSKPAPGDGMPAPKKRSFGNVSSKENNKNNSTQTDCKVNRHFGVQTEERLIETKNVGTQTDLQQGVQYRSVATQVTLRNEHRSIGIQTESHRV